MKTIGLIGGTSWESTAAYYRLLNEGVRARRGGLHSARLLLVSVDFAPFAAAMAAGAWDTVAAAMAAAARQLEAGGADLVALCTNTMHKVADAVASATALPFLSILDATGRALAAAKVRRPLLLATATTMADPFYRVHLQDRFGLAVTVPAPEARARLHAIIFDELCRGRLVPASKAELLAMLADGQRAGCDGVILGCTELGLLLSQADSPLPVFDTTALHCDALLDAAFASLPLESQAA